MVEWERTPGIRQKSPIMTKNKKTKRILRTLPENREIKFNRWLKSQKLDVNSKTFDVDTIKVLKKYVKNPNSLGKEYTSWEHLNKLFKYKFINRPLNTLHTLYNKKINPLLTSIVDEKSIRQYKLIGKGKKKRKKKRKRVKKTVSKRYVRGG